VPGASYELLFIAEGRRHPAKQDLPVPGDRRALLTSRVAAARFLEEKIPARSATSACPPLSPSRSADRHGTSAEFTLKTGEALRACHALDDLPDHRATALGAPFRDRGLEASVFQLCREVGIGAQFGGKYFAHDVRVIRLPRHGASCPVGLGVSCSADRQAYGKITRDGVFLEQLEEHPSRFLPEVTDEDLGADVVRIDLNRPMREILAELSKHPVATRLSLTGPMVVARDIAHAKLKERLDQGGDLPQYFKDHMVYYAGPASARRVTPRARSGRPRPDAWTPTSICSRAGAGAW
jgi:fumarate hydratase class I